MNVKKTGETSRPARINAYGRVCKFINIVTMPAHLQGRGEMKGLHQMDDNSLWVNHFNIKHFDSIICGDLLSKVLIPRRTSRGRGTWGPMLRPLDREKRDLAKMVIL
jgi:hypothetical protein